MANRWVPVPGMKVIWDLESEIRSAFPHAMRSMYGSDNLTVGEVIPVGDGYCATVLKDGEPIRHLSDGQWSAIRWVDWRYLKPRVR